MCVKAEIELVYQAMGYCAAKIVGVEERELWWWWCSWLTMKGALGAQTHALRG